MSLFKKLGLVEDNKKEEVKKPVVKEQVSNTTVILPVDNNKFTEFFKSVIEQNNIKGPDYYEFVQAIQSMETQPLPENSKFAAVFAGFAAQGVTKASLIESARFYITKLDEHATGFKASISELTKQEVDSRMEELNDITKNNQDIQKAISELNEKLNNNAQRSIVLNAEINQHKQEISTKEVTFNSTLEQFKQSINQNIQKIEQYVS